MFLFIGLFFLLLGCLLVSIKLYYVVKGIPVPGQIVGFVKGARGTYGFVGYNYRIRLEHNEEIHYVTAIESITTTSRSVPRKNLGMHCVVYFNPENPKGRVTMKGYHFVVWIGVFLFFFGLIFSLLGAIVLI